MEKLLNDYSFRKITEEDISDIQQLFMIQSGRKVSDDKLRDSIKNFPNFILSVFGELIGFAYTNSFSPDIVELSNIFIKEENRGQGLGSKLLLEIEGEVRVIKKNIILVNSLGYGSDEGKKFADKFYLRASYDLIIDTGLTKVFYKNIF